MILSIFIEFSIEIVAGDFPLLVGLEVMRNHQLIINYGKTYYVIQLRHGH